MSTVDGASATTVIQYANMDQALGAGDIEAVMLMLGIERAQTAEDVVETALTALRGSRAKVVSGLANKIGAFLGGHAPHVLSSRAMARALRPKYQKDQADK